MRQKGKWGKQDILPELFLEKAGWTAELAWKGKKGNFVAFDEI